MLAQLGRAAMVPLWAAQLVTGSKSFERNRLIGSRWLNERGLHAARVRLAHRVAALPEGSMIMHPGPMNRGVEIASDVADLPQSVITEQVTNGIAVRMSLLYLMLGGASE